MKNLIFTVLILWVSPCFAQEAYTDCTELPDTAAGNMVKPLLKALNSNDPIQIENFIKQKFTKEFIDVAPMEMHVSMMLHRYKQHGDISFYSVRNYENPQSETKMNIILRTTRTELWQEINFNVTSEKPYKITGMRISDANKPNNLPKPSSLAIAGALNKLDDYVKRMSKKGVFSGSVLVAKDGLVLYKAAHGMASKRFNIPNTVQTKFNLGSMNKMFTSIGIMQLVEAGKLSLNDKLSRFVDESWLKKEVSEKIEIRHLLTHTSGLGNYFNKSFMDSSKNNYRDLNNYKLLIKNEVLRFDPGTDARYSNTGMFMLGVVIEKVTGVDYFDYIRDHIYKPVGMVNTDSYEMDQPVFNLAIGYEPNSNNQTGWKNNLFRSPLKGSPAGGGFSTVDDLHHFAVALTNFNLLSEKSTKELYSAKPSLHSHNYGFGFKIQGTKNDRIVGHGGGFEGISTNLDIYLDQGYVSVVLSNYGGGSRPIEKKIRELLALVD